MPSKNLEFSFAKVGYGLEYFPISDRCWNHLLNLVFILAKLEWLLEILNCHLQRLIMVWGTFPPFLNVGYHLLNLVYIFHNLNDF
jgi:hypothetical protein